MPDATIENPVPVGTASGPKETALPLRVVLAWRNLAHDRVRFVVMLVGIVFAVTLMAVQTGLLIGFITTIALPVASTEADIWVAARGARSVDMSGVMPERWRFQALSVPGVAAADPYIHNFARLKRPDGGTEMVLVVGFDLNTGRGAPPNIVEGSVADLAVPDSIIVDRLYKQKLGISRIGQVLEINGKRVRVVGFTEGIRTFTQSPHVFADIKTARHLVGYGEDWLNYILIEVAPGADPVAVRAQVAARMPETDVYLKEEFARRSWIYWLIETGAGFSLLISSALGLLVGAVITAQTLYATTIDRLSEYATLRAMGAPNAYLYAIILLQAAIAAAIGCAVGLAIAGTIVWAARESSAALLMPLELWVGLIIATFAMCSAAAVISIRKVVALDPASVFK
jgi:putative ABC transport system permease protein